MRNRCLLALVALLATLAPALAQKPLQSPTDPPTGDDDPGAAARYFVESRGIERGDLYPWDRLVTAREHNLRMPHWDSGRWRYVGAGAGDISSWTSLGPSNSGGRTRVIVPDPSQPGTLYAGAVSGGVWKSTDGGTSWNALDDLMGNLAVCALAMDPSNGSRLYAGTGEGFYPNADAVRGDGIFRTTDGGSSWAQLASTASNTNFYYVNDIVVSPSSSSRLYAATKTGIWRSTDTGAGWTQVVSRTGIGCLDLAIRTDQATDYLVATCGEFNPGGEILRNTDAAGAGIWNTVLDTSTEPNMGRTALAIAPSAQGTIYALAADRGGPNPTSFTDALYAVFRSLDGGATWTARVRNTDPNALNHSLLSYVQSCACSGSCSGQAAYDMAIAVDPIDAQRVWVAGTEALRSDDGGANWGHAPGFHPDVHAFAFHPSYDGSSNKTMYVGHDGGITTTADARAGLSSNPCVFFAYPWTTANAGYGVLQFYHGVAYPDALTYFGGSQDNGTRRGTDGGGPTGWSLLLGGDGAYAAVNPSNTNQIFGSQQNFALYRSDNGGGSWSPKNATFTDSNRAFIQAYVMDPNTPTRLWTAGYAPWRTDDSGDNWVQRGTFPNPSNSYREITAVAVAKGNSDRVLIGTNYAELFGTTDGTAATPTWIDQSTGLGSGTISSITFDPSDASKVWLTKSTFNGNHLYRSTDGGASWTLRIGSGATSIPDIPAHTVAVHPTNSAWVYVGTDLGVYVSTDSGATWAVENTGFANVVVEQLQFATLTGSNTLFAFTHGRGAWRATISSGASAQPGEVPDSGANALKLAKPTTGTSLDLQIDAGPNAGALWCGSGNTSASMNRLTPGGTFPMQLDQVQIYFPTAASAGTSIDIFVYRDTDGDGNPANATLGTRFTTTVTTSNALNSYAVSPPVSLTSGDYYVGFSSTPTTSGHAQMSVPSNGLSSWVVCDDGSNPAGFVSLNSIGFNDAFVFRAHVVTAVDPNAVILTWGPPCNAGSVPGQDYAVYRGTIASPWTYDHASINCAVGAQTLTYSDGGSAQYYIVVPHTGTAEGSYGGSAPPATAPCLAQGTPDLCP